MEHRNSVPILTRASLRVKNNATNGLIQSRLFQVVLSKPRVDPHDGHARFFGTTPYNFCPRRARSKVRSNILCLAHKSKTARLSLGRVRFPPVPRQYAEYVQAPSC